MKRERQPLREGLQSQRDRHRARRLFVRVVFAVTGFVVVLGGLAMLVLPGPGMVTIAIGLSMLALEFAWAERLLGKALDRLEHVLPKEHPRLLRIVLVAAGVLGVLSLIAGIVAILFLDMPW